MCCSCFGLCQNTLISHDAWMRPTWIEQITTFCVQNMRISRNSSRLISEAISRIFRPSNTIMANGCNENAFCVHLMWVNERHSLCVWECSHILVSLWILNVSFSSLCCVLLFAVFSHSAWHFNWCNYEMRCWYK